MFCYKYIRIFVPVEIFTNVTLCFALHVVLQCNATLSLHIFHTVSFALIYTSTFGGTTLISVFLMQWFCSAVLLCNQQAVPPPRNVHSALLPIPHSTFFEHHLLYIVANFSTITIQSFCCPSLILYFSGITCSILLPIHFILLLILYSVFSRHHP